MPPRMRRPRTNGRKKARKPAYKRRSAPKLGLRTFNKMLAKASEKKRFYIAPIALTNGDITCVAPINSHRNGGAISGLTQPVAIGQQFSQTSTVGLTTIGGWMCMDITPYPSETSGFGGREGSQINLNSSYMQFKFAQMGTNTLTPIKIKMVIVSVAGAPQDSSTALQQFYLNSALPNGTGINSNNGVIDYNSSISPDQRSQYKVIYKKTTTLWQDNIDAGLQVKQHLIKLKYNKGAGHRVRYLQNSNSITHGQLLMFVTCDAGNINDTWSFTGPGFGTMTNNLPSSGATMNFNICHYFTDP